MIHIFEIYTDDPTLDEPRGPQELVRVEAYLHDWEASKALIEAQDQGLWVGERSIPAAQLAAECFGHWAESMRLFVGWIVRLANSVDGTVSIS